MYSIEGNVIFRDGVKICEIDRAGFLNWADADAQRYVSPIVKFLQEVDRYDRETGMAVWLLEGSEDQEPEKEDVPEVSQAPAPAEKKVVKLSKAQHVPEAPELSTVTELVAAVEKVCGEKAPEMSPFYGDNTPEVHEWLNRQASALAEVKATYQFTGALAERKDI